MMPESSQTCSANSGKDNATQRTSNSKLSLYNFLHLWTTCEASRKINTFPSQRLKMCQWVNVGTKSLFNYTGYETEQKHKKTRNQEKKTLRSSVLSNLAQTSDQCCDNANVPWKSVYFLFIASNAVFSEKGSCESRFVEWDPHITLLLLQGKVGLFPVDASQT